MPISILRLASVLLLGLIVSTSATAAPKLEMHRVGVNVDDGSGWYLAVSTKGSFSILLPIPFNDFTTLDPSTGEVSHVVGGKSSEGIKFTAVELPATAKTPVDLAAIPKSFSSNPANKVSDISRNTKDDVDNLFFSVANPATTAHFRYIRMKDTLYILTIEYPNAYRDMVAGKKDKFFGSLKLNGKSDRA
ncbi:hypothetical protein ACFIOY_24210 [Bradyrhizobium sp. TZ2]